MPDVTIEIVCEEGVEIPEYSREGDAGIDIRSNEGLVLKPFERKAVHTGLYMAIPSGFAALMLPRSGLSLKQGLTLPNAPGLIDSNYRGEILIPLVNLDKENDAVIEPGDRIAQLVVIQVPTVGFRPVYILDETCRGQEGFGSSGVR